MAEWRQQLSRLLFLALFFFAGVILGQVFSGRIPDATGDELARYLTDFLEVERADQSPCAALSDFLKVGEGEPTPRTVLSAAALYFRYPLAAFLLSFASIGVLLLPLITGAFGFFLSFSVCCFTAAFGSDGVLLALAVFGRGDVALLFSAGRSSMGTFGDFGLSVSWRRTADCTCAVRPGVVDPLCGDFRSASGGDVRGLDAGPLVFAAAFRANPVWIRNTVFDW